MTSASGQPIAPFGRAKLSRAQRELLSAWLPDARIVADLGWGGAMESFVLEVVSGSERLIVKAGGPSNHHIGRELDAHDGWIDVWAREGVATRLRHASRAERIFVAERVPGELIDATEAALDPGVHRRAGEMLRVFHDQAARTGDERLIDRIGRALAGKHRIPTSTVAAVERLVNALAPEPVDLVPTHGDWQPRNWLLDGDVVRVIDFGRFSFRSRASDLVRLDAQQWRDSPVCETAFLVGYGDDPRYGDHWTALRVLEAVGTAAWAYQMGDEEFEAQGHRMIAEALETR